MDEKTLEDIICKYPDLVEEKLSFKGRQVYLSGKRVDVLCEDKYGQKLIIEIKKGTILREHIAQLLDYEGYFVSSDDPDVRVMLVGNRVPENLRRSLNHHGFEWRELTVTFLVNFLKQVGDKTLIDRFPKEEVVLDESITRIESKSKQSNLSQAKAQSTLQVKNPKDLIVKLLKSPSGEKFRTIELHHKIEREQNAWKLIQENKGSYCKEMLNEFFDMVDKDTHNRRWFGSLLAAPNRNLILNNSPEQFSRWIEVLLFSDLEPSRSLNICINDIGIKGARNGLATLMLYLSNPKKYNIWLPAIEQGVVILGLISKFNGSDYGSYYRSFNEAVIQIRDENKLLPQEVDWLLSYIPSYIAGKEDWYYK